MPRPTTNVDILGAINRVQLSVIEDAEPRVFFDELLAILLEFTESEYGFIGEILQRDDGRPYLKTHAITNVAWDDDTRRFYDEYAPVGMEFDNLLTLFGACIRTGAPVVANSPDTDDRAGGRPPGHPPLEAFLGIPLYHNDKLVGMAGIANRAGGYDESLIDELTPLLQTIATLVASHRFAHGHRQAQEELNRIFELSRDLICAADMDGYFRRVNPAFTASLGHSQVELERRRFVEFVHPEDVEHTMKAFNELREGHPVDFENRCVAKDGETRWLSWRATPAPEGFIYAVARDITALKKEDEARRSLEEQLRHSQRLESIGLLAGGIAHDFNNILMVILGNVDLARRKLAQGQSISKLLATMAGAGERAALLSRQLLAFGRRQVMQPVVIDVHDLIDRFLTLMGRLIPENIEIRTRFEARPACANVDPAQFEQVVLNLVINARDALPSGGTLIIATSLVEVDDGFRRSRSWATEDEYLRVRFLDDGRGMDESTRERVFEPFYTTKAPGEGSGLGLPTVYGIVTQHGGMVELESRPNRGTTVSVYLPALTSPADLVQPTSTDAFERGTETVLVAEDDELVRDFVTGVLEEAGYSVRPASDGVEAVRIFEAAPEEIDLVLLDVVMPKMGGRDAYDAMSRHEPAPRFLFVSGYSTADLTPEFIAERGLKVVAKPYRALELLRQVRATLDA